MSPALFKIVLAMQCFLSGSTFRFKFFMILGFEISGVKFSQICEFFQGTLAAFRAKAGS